jgi:radical SAM protein with 4Fe4S-binding SPASM domain
LVWRLQGQPADLKMWNQYAYLTSGNELHLTPKGGTLFSNGTPIKLSISATEFAVRCTGTHTIGQILSSSRCSNWQDLEIIGFIASAIDEGWLATSEAPVYSGARITGSKTAFYPPHMSLELTAACNLFCQYCYRESDATKQGHMPVKTLLKILANLEDAGLRSVELTGGEPLLNSGFEQILDFCSRRFEMVGVLSNGTLITEKLANKLAGIGNKLMISISLDSSIPEIHDKRRGVFGAFQQTVTNIKKLATLGVAVRVSMVVDEANFAELEKTLLLAKELGARAFSYTPTLPLGRGKDCFSRAWSLGFKEIADKEKELSERYRGFLGILPVDSICEIEGEGGCGAGYRTFAMDPWGNIRPCATFDTNEIVFGNLLTQSLEEVFSHPVILAMTKLRAPSHAFCAGCNHEGFCRYCSLRGLRASQSEVFCAWRQQEAVNELLPFWNPPFGS